MKFITEEDLRSLYKSRPFTSYDTEPGTRLTPGARQFLSDRGIRPGKGEGIPPGDSGGNGKAPPLDKVPGRDSRKKLLVSRLKSVEALFLEAGAELLNRDVVLSQEVMKLHTQLGSMRNHLNSNCQVKDLEGTGCTGICLEDCSRDLEDCFEITAFHMQTPKGADIVLLHRLRCALRELNAQLEVWYPGEEPEETRQMCQEMTVKTNQIVNALSIMICLAFGGKTCQRK